MKYYTLQVLVTFFNVRGFRDDSAKCKGTGCRDGTIQAHLGVQI